MSEDHEVDGLTRGPSSLALALLVRASAPRGAGPLGPDLSNRSQP
jgi:hypothetical protein